MSAACFTRYPRTVRRRGETYRAAFSRGLVVDALRRVGPCGRSGTRVRFLPDRSIFPRVAHDIASWRKELHMLAHLHPSLTIDFQGERLAEREGLAAYVRRLAEVRGGHVGSAVVTIAGCSDRVWVDAALSWARDHESLCHSYVCSQRTLEGGTHHLGLLRGVGDALGIEAHARELVMPGLVAALHIGLNDPRFGGPTRDRLISPVAETAVREVVRAGMEDALRHDAALATFLRARLPA